jgi:hypothetical protein
VPVSKPSSTKPDPFHIIITLFYNTIKINKQDCWLVLYLTHLWWNHTAHPSHIGLDLRHLTITEHFYLFMSETQWNLIILLFHEPNLKFLSHDDGSWSSKLFFTKLSVNNARLSQLLNVSLVMETYSINSFNELSWSESGISTSSDDMIL